MPPIIEQARKHGSTILGDRLEADLLLCHCLGKSRSHLLAWPEQTLSTHQWQHYQDCLGQRQSGKPLAYITGVREFWSMEFKVTAATLIPRPETETLVQLCLEKISTSESALIVDLGCGCGAIALAIAKERPYSHVIATDKCAQALQVARLNAKNLNIRNVSFLQSNWLNAFAPKCFDMVVSNPPYIDTSDPHLAQNGLPFEPQTALVADANGLADLATISQQARQHMKPHAWLLMEHGYQQGSDVISLLNSNRYVNVNCVTDLEQRDRVCLAQSN